MLTGQLKKSHYRGEKKSYLCRLIDFGHCNNRVIYMNVKKKFGPLVSVEWLFEHLHSNNLIILDASLQSSVGGGAIDQELAEARIGNAGHFDIDNRICDFTSPLPHTMPSPEHFSKEVRRLGVNQESIVVVYDKLGLYSAPRAWWMFKVMGHEQVAVLDGGLPAWKQAGLPLNREEATLPMAGNFSASFISHRLRNASEVLALLGSEDTSILDARSKSRFWGKTPEPRTGLKSGHMPHAVNIPFENVICNGKMLPPEELAKLFIPYTGGNLEKELIASCGSGVTACLLLLAAYSIGYSKLALYDGSWSEWGSLPNYPVTL